jgi:hypothetical protein
VYRIELDQPVSAIAFSTDGRRLAVATGKEVTIYAVDDLLKRR